MGKRRRQAKKTRPLIFCIVSRRGILHDDALVEEAKFCGGLVTILDFGKLETQQYMTHVLGNADLEPCLVDYVYRVSGGNPFAIGELCKTLKEQGAMEDTGYHLKP